MKSISTLLLLSVVCLLFSCKTSRDTTPYEYALISAHVYDDGDQKLPSKFSPYMEYEKEKKSGGFKIGSFLRGLDMAKVSALTKSEDYGELLAYMGFKVFATGGYFGRAYINEKSNQLIIAHRGTDFDIGAASDAVGGKGNGKKMKWKNLKAALQDLDDDFDIYAGRIPREQFLEAKAFTEQIREQYRQQHKKEPNVVHTGHSLGAVLAELCAVSDTCKAVTFESPGCRPFIDELQRLEREEYDLSKVDITVYNNRPNRINSLHPQLGTVVPLYRAEEAPQAQGLMDEKVLIDNISGHSIDSLLARFDTRSGKPKKSK